MNNLTILRTVSDLRAALQPIRQRGEAIALVPTMGALHAGHLSLVDRAAQAARHVVVSIFVNPKQFAPHEDFGAYPRSEDADFAQLTQTPARLVFAPAAHEMYPPDHATTVSVGGPAQDLEGAFRPHFFSGVATVVAQLFGQTQPDVAVFGEKDFQQLLVIRRMVADLALPIQIIGAPTAREGDGLARSSRNVYLSAEERRIAPALYRALQDAALSVKAGRSIAAAERAGAETLIEAGFAGVDYFTIRDGETLEPLGGLKHPARALAAAKLGKTRLIDNIAI